MKRKLEKPEVKIVKLQRMDVIATSSGDTPPTNNAKAFVNSLNSGDVVKMGSWVLQ